MKRVPANQGIACRVLPIGRHPRVGFGVLGPSPNSDNLIATNVYFHDTPVKTAKAAALQKAWADWWLKTGNPDNYWTYVPDAVWDEARNRRLAFDLANATTQAEAQQVVDVATQGISSEQAQGQPDRRDPQTGFIPVTGLNTNTGATIQPFSLPGWVKPAIIGAGIVAVGIAAVPLIRKVIIPI